MKFITYESMDGTFLAIIRDGRFITDLACSFSELTNVNLWDNTDVGTVGLKNVLPVPEKDLALYSHWPFKTPKYFELLEKSCS